LKSACEKLGQREVTNRPRPLAALYAMPKGEPFCVNPKVSLQQRIRGYEQGRAKSECGISRDIGPTTWRPMRTHPMRPIVIDTLRIHVIVCLS